MPVTTAPNMIATTNRYAMKQSHIAANFGVLIYHQTAAMGNRQATIDLGLPWQIHGGDMRRKFMQDFKQRQSKPDQRIRSGNDLAQAHRYDRPVCPCNQRMLEYGAVTEITTAAKRVRF